MGGWATDGSSLGESTNPCTKKRYNASPQDGFIVLTANDPFGGPDGTASGLSQIIPTLFGPITPDCLLRRMEYGGVKTVLPLLDD